MRRNHPTIELVGTAVGGLVFGAGFMWAVGQDEQPNPGEPHHQAEAPTLSSSPTMGHDEDALENSAGACDEALERLAACEAVLQARMSPESMRATGIEETDPIWLEHVSEWNAVVDGELPSCLQSARLEFHDCSAYPCVVALRPEADARAGDIEDEIRSCPEMAEFLEQLDGGGGVWESEIACGDGPETVLWFSGVSQDSPLYETINSADLVYGFAVAAVRAAEASGLWECGRNPSQR